MNFDFKNIEDSLNKLELIPYLKLINEIPWSTHDIIYISFDCANRSLAYTNATINKLKINISGKMRRDMERFNFTPEDYLNYLQLMKTLLLGSISVHGIKCIDILDGVLLKDTDTIERTSKLKEFLDREIFIMGHTDNFYIIIENQPVGMNSESTIVQAQLMSYFLQFVKKENIILMKPSAKNKINTSVNLSYDVFIRTANSKYEANKAHSTANFIYLAELFGFINLIDTTQYSIIDNIADSFMQLVAHIAKN